MHNNLADALTVERTITVTAGAAGMTTINGTAVDMANHEGALFVVQFGAIAAGAVTSIKVQQSDDDGATDTYDDLAGSNQAVAVADAEKVFYVDIFRPRKRYVRIVVSRATANATCSAIVAKYGARKYPTSQGTGVTGETHVSPAEGTA